MGKRGGRGCEPGLLTADYGELLRRLFEMKAGGSVGGGRRGEEGEISREGRECEQKGREGLLSKQVDDPIVV